jgi:hypothetical protein
MKAYAGLEVKLQAFIISALDGSEFLSRYKSPSSKGLFSVTLIQGCTNPGRQFAVADKVGFKIR